MTLISWLVLGIILLLAVVIYLLFVVGDVRTLVKQLRFINLAQTNKQLSVQTRNHHVVELTRQINQLITHQQATHQQSVKTKQQLDLAIHNISHDLRTPLTVASGYSQILLTDETLPATEHAQIEKLNRNLAMLSKHLDLLLLYNRLLENRITISLKPLNLSNLLTQTCLNFYDALQQRQIETELHITPNLMWDLDEEAMNRVLQNILGNILDHGYEHASIVLKQANDGITLVATNRLTAPIEHFDKLLGRFYSEDLSHTNQNAGLGLYIIAELVRMQGGEVSLESHDLEFEIKVVFKQNR